MYRAINLLKLSGAIIACALFAGCGEEGRAPFGNQEASMTLGFEGRTTRGDLATRNLSSQIAGREAVVSLRPADLTARAHLVDLLLARAQYLGTYSDFDRASTLAVSLSDHQDASDALLTIQARVDNALHRFSTARTRIQALDKQTLSSVELQSTIDLALNRDVLAIRNQRRATAESYPSYDSLTAWAVAEVTLGHYEMADGLFVRALQAYGDASPFPVAWIQFQRGVMWAEAANQPERAGPLYREAVARLPDYVVANVHLAELEAEMGDLEGAIERLRRIVAKTEDPEPAGLLGELLSTRDPATAKGFIDEARARYDALLARYPAAFADHGAEFFSGPGGDPQRALVMALDNLERRPTSRAYQVAIEVAHAAEESELACQLARRTQHLTRTVVLDTLVNDVLSDCQTPVGQ
jgi:tetratricopeptide (TPR) repeat protein